MLGAGQRGRMMVPLRAAQRRRASREAANLVPGVGGEARQQLGPRRHPLRAFWLRRRRTSQHAARKGRRVLVRSVLSSSPFSNVTCAICGTFSGSARTRLIVGGARC